MASGVGRGARAGWVLAVVLLGGFARCGDPRPMDTIDPSRWQLTWQDEFEGAAGTAPDPARWVHDVGGDGWGNAQLEYDTDRVENAALDGAGHLAIVARKESYGGRAYTSARINTRGRFQQAGGRFEARLQLPSGRGLWPAFWLLGASFPQVGWPACGEIDVMEYRGQEPARVHGSLHGPGFSGGEAETAWFDLPSGRFDDGFHVFAVEWTPDRITWLVDDRPYQTVRRGEVPEWPFDAPFFVILNVAVGGNYVGPPDATTTFPQTMLVDWVRVYALGP